MRNNHSVASATADTTTTAAANSSSSSSSISTSIANRRNRVKTPTKTIRSRIKRKSIVDINIHNTTNIDINNNIDTIDFNMNQSQQISELLSSVVSNNTHHHHSSLSTQLINSSPSATSSLLVSTSSTAATTTTTSTMSISDQVSILILILLYTLQGIPMGLSASIPVILKEKGASYGSLSLFSLVSLPFSLKLLWAPLVDSYYIKSFGRRKTWLIPIQMITGIVMITGSYHIQSWLGHSSSSSGDGSSNSSDGTTPSVTKLTIFFLFLYFLMATQDIAVDGWALTMLSRDSVGYASICNSVGQVLGIFIANQGFIALSDINWCKTYLNIAPLINLSDFMLFWGYIFIIITILILIFKKEEIMINKNNINDDQSSTNGETLFETCQQVLSILQLPAIKSFAFILLTYKIAFAPADAIFNFKLQVTIYSDYHLLSISSSLSLLCLPPL